MQHKNNKYLHTQPSCFSLGFDKAIILLAAKAYEINFSLLILNFLYYNESAKRFVQKLWISEFCLLQAVVFTFSLL